MACSFLFCILKVRNLCLVDKTFAKILLNFSTGQTSILTTYFVGSTTFINFSPTHYIKFYQNLLQLLSKASYNNPLYQSIRKLNNCNTKVEVRNRDNNVATFWTYISHIFEDKNLSIEGTIYGKRI